MKCRLAILTCNQLFRPAQIWLRLAISEQRKFKNVLMRSTSSGKVLLIWQPTVRGALMRLLTFIRFVGWQELFRKWEHSISLSVLLGVLSGKHLFRHYNPPTHAFLSRTHPAKGIYEEAHLHAHPCDSNILRCLDTCFWQLRTLLSCKFWQLFLNEVNKRSYTW